MSEETGFLWDSSSLGQEVFIRMPDKSRKDMKGPQAYASFGDEGTTASVNAFGHIIQISQFAAYGPSGFVCVDTVDESPYWVADRMSDLMKIAMHPENGLRLDLVEWRKFQNVPSLGYMYDRWPRYIYSQRPADKSSDSSKTSKKQDHPTDTTKNSRIPERADTKVLDNSAQSSSTSAFPLSIQYFCYKGTIVQKYLINLGEGGLSHEQIKWGDLRLTPGIFIRDLDFVDYEAFGSHPWRFNQSKIVISENTLVISCKLPPLTPAKDDRIQPTGGTVALFISPFVNGKAAKIDESNCIKIEEADRIELDSPAESIRLEISIAYTLKVLPRNITEDLRPSDTESLSIKTKETMQAMDREFTEQSEFRRIYFSPSSQLDLVYRRNLEHILSVCCIPLSMAYQEGSSSDGVVATAITCGDISGHRVGPRASLSAMQYLKAMLTYLNSENEASTLRARNRKANLESSRKLPIEKDTKAQEDYKDNQTGGIQDYALTLYDRVRSALRGHIRWICEKAEANPADPNGAFATHYWPTGSAIRNLEYLSPPSLADTPIQLIKVLIYLGIADHWDIPEWIRIGLKEKAQKWLESLHSSNERATYAFPRQSSTTDTDYDGDEESSETKYSLADHVMIAMAVQCIEKLWPLVQNQQTQPPSPESETHQLQQSPSEQVQQSRPPTSDSLDSVIPQLYQPPSEQVQYYYTYEEVKRKILKRFTTENPITKQRTLSTSRWPDKTRFLFHYKDTILFFAVHQNFFEKSVKASKRIAGAKKSSKFDPFAEAWKRVDERWTRLLELQSYHDEFRRLDWSDPLWCAIAFVLSCQGKRVNNQSPEMLATEIRRVLLEKASSNGIFPALFGPDGTPAMFERESERDNYWFATFELPYVLWTSDNLDTASMVSVKPGGSSSIAAQSEMQSNNKDIRGIGQQVEKHVLFDRLTSTKDQTGLVLLSDDWLSDPPEILGFQQKTGADSTNHFKGMSFDQLSASANGTVIDISRYSLGTEISSPRPDVHNFMDRLAAQRSIWKSKKRVVWLPHCDKTTAKSTLTASSKTENDNISLFLGRHDKQDIYFFDSATAALNEWETELHLSFYRISKDKTGSLHSLEGSTFLALTTVSFHFSGDFADRFWTCYFLEDGTGVERSMSLGSRLSPHEDSGIRGGLNLTDTHTTYTLAEKASFRRTPGERTTRPWQQRRVLELLMYSKMLESMRKDSDGIFNEVRRLALHSKNEHGAVSGRDPFERGIQEAQELRKLANEDHYFSVASRWRDLVQILRVIEDKLSVNLERINEWRRREQDRRNQQPRWTKADEQTYRTTLLRLEVFTQRQARDIERLLVEIEKFRESLPSQLETIRDDLSFLGSQNINLFTYVTIVFLPLGFATGILSMNGKPEPSLLSSLYILAFSALGITIFALLNAKTAKALATPMAKAYGQTSGLVGWFMWQLMTIAYYHLVAKHIISHFGVKEQNSSKRTEPRVSEDSNWRHWYNEFKNFEIRKAKSRRKEELVKKLESSRAATPV